MYSIVNKFNRTFPGFFFDLFIAFNYKFLCHSEWVVDTWVDLNISFVNGTFSFGSSWYSEQFEQFPLKITMEILWRVGFFFYLFFECQPMSVFVKDTFIFTNFVLLCFSFKTFCSVYYLNRYYLINISPKLNSTSFYSLSLSSEFNIIKSASPIWPFYFKIAKFFKWISSQTLTHVYTWAIAPCKSYSNVRRMNGAKKKREREKQQSSQGKKRL